MVCLKISLRKLQIQINLLTIRGFYSRIDTNKISSFRSRLGFPTHQPKLIYFFFLNFAFLLCAPPFFGSWPGFVGPICVALSPTPMSFVIFWFDHSMRVVRLHFSIWTLPNGVLPMIWVHDSAFHFVAVSCPISFMSREISSPRSCSQFFLKKIGSMFDLNHQRFVTAKNENIFIAL